MKEDDIIDFFVQEYGRKDDVAIAVATRKRRRKNALNDVPAKRGEQVAARITLDGETAWILALVLSYNPETR